MHMLYYSRFIGPSAPRPAETRHRCQSRCKWCWCWSASSTGRIIIG